MNGRRPGRLGSFRLTPQRLDSLGSETRPERETDIDEALVRALLLEQHPDLAGLEPQKVAGRWDNQQWRLGEEVAVLPETGHKCPISRKSALSH